VRRCGLGFSSYPAGPTGLTLVWGVLGPGAKQGVGVLPLQVGGALVVDDVAVMGLAIE